MTHIEFIGPPGVGKSMVCKKVIKKTSLYGGVIENAVERELIQHRYPRFGQILRLVPNRISNQLKYRMALDHVESFLNNNPKHLFAIISELESVDHDVGGAFHCCYRTLEHHQLGVKTKKCNETLCMDEGFYQRAGSLAWRREIKEVKSKYLDFSPDPSLIIYLDAPVDVCLSRQQDRGRYIEQKKWIDDEQTAMEEFDQILNNLCERARRKDIPVCRVENTTEVKKTVANVIRNLSKNGLVK